MIDTQVAGNSLKTCTYFILKSTYAAFYTISSENYVFYAF